MRDAAQVAGLRVRGAFHPGPDDEVPDVDGVAAETLVLFGNLGGSMWPALTRSGMLDGRADPVDTWSREVIEPLAARFKGLALYPFGGPPFQPFLRWACKAEPVFPSRMGPLIHETYGLWHAYRGALALGCKLTLPLREPTASPCETCVGQPCLSTCPVDAMAPGRYDVAKCVEFAGSEAGAGCRDFGCEARRACPVGQAHVYSPAQAHHHMAVFIRNVQRRKGC